MRRSSNSLGLVIAVIAAATFGTSGAFIKPLLECGWSPAAAVTVRVLTGGIVLAPLAAASLRGRWAALWRSRWRIIAMALVGVAGTQLAYFAAVQRIPVSTAILIEYLAPLLLVALAWARSRKAPKAAVLIGSGVALAGLVLVVSPGGIGGIGGIGGTSGTGGASHIDVLGVSLALTAMVGGAGYYLVAARSIGGLPPVALASSGLLLGGGVLALAGTVGLVPFTATFGQVRMFGGTTAWWIPLVVVGIVGTAIAYAAGITASEKLGSRLASFVGLLEVVAATFYAWLLLGERLTGLQFVGGALILVGIGFVRSEKADVALEPGSADAVTRRDSRSNSERDSPAH